MTCVDFLRKHFPGSTEQEYRAHLGRYGLTGDLGLNEISTLSGGQKAKEERFSFSLSGGVCSHHLLSFSQSRLVFAWMSFTNPHLMVLDEPEVKEEERTVFCFDRRTNTRRTISMWTQWTLSPWYLSSVLFFWDFFEPFFSLLRR